MFRPVVTKASIRTAAVLGWLATVATGMAMLSAYASTPGAPLHGWRKAARQARWGRTGPTGSPGRGRTPACPPSRRSARQRGVGLREGRPALGPERA